MLSSRSAPRYSSLYGHLLSATGLRIDSNIACHTARCVWRLFGWARLRMHPSRAARIVCRSSPGRSGGGDHSWRNIAGSDGAPSGLPSLLLWGRAVGCVNQATVGRLHADASLKPRVLRVLPGLRPARRGWDHSHAASMWVSRALSINAFCSATCVEDPSLGWATRLVEREAGCLAFPPHVRETCITNRLVGVGRLDSFACYTWYSLVLVLS